MSGNNGAMQPGGRSPRTPRKPGTGRFGGRRRLAMIGVAGESVAVLVGAAGWRVSGEPAWIIMSVVSLAFALIMLRQV